MDHLSPDHPDHPSNQLHDAAYPTSDYQPANVRQPAPLSEPPRAGEGSGKFAEIAAPSLATTSAREPEWQHGPGPSHLDTSFGPPPSYEQSQSHSRPTTSSQPGPSPNSVSATAVSPGTKPTTLTPTSPNTSINSATPLRPGGTYHAFGRSSVEPAVAAGNNVAGSGSTPAVGVPPPPAAAAAAAAAAASSTGLASSYGSGNGGSTAPVGSPYHKVTSHMVSMKRRRRKRWCICAVLTAVFIVALCIGVYIGVKGLGNDDDDNKSDDYKKFADHRGETPPPWVESDDS